MIVNVHTRRLKADARDAGRLIDSLASRDDTLWPRDRWPAMRLDRPLGTGARGGHGPIRYRVSEYLPGERVVFVFDPATGLAGTHALEVLTRPEGGSLLRHVMEAHAYGAMRLRWPLAIRWLHDALIEDAFDRAQAALGDPRPGRARWSGWVRLMRRAVARRGG